MKKFLLSLVALMMSLTASWAGELKVTFPMTDQVSVSAYSSNWTGKDTNDNQWRFVNFNNNKNGWAYIRCGWKTQANTSVISSPLIANKVTSYIIKVDKTASVTSAKLEVLKSDSATVIETIAVTLKAGSDTVTLTGSTDAYYRFTIENEKTSTNGTTQISAITLITENTSGKKDANLKWTPSSMTYVQGTTFTAPTFSKETTADVKFNVDDDEVATVDANGVISLAGGIGDVTITATSEANDEYEAGKATCVIKVNRKVDTLTVTCAKAAEAALALSANNTASYDYYDITGYVTNTDGNVSNGQQIFWVADEKDGGKVFEGYWMNLPAATKDIDGDGQINDNDKEAITVGSKVRMFGKIMKYNSTPEMKNGTVIVLEEAVVKVDTIECTAAEAYAACKELASGDISTNVYKITAYVDSVTYKYANGSTSFTLTDTKRVHGDSLVVYKTNVADTVYAGDKVCVLGRLQNYNGTVMEVASGSKTTISPRGDVNNDGQVNIADVNAVITVICGGEANQDADVNNDGEVNIADVNAVITKICGGE